MKHERSHGVEVLRLTALGVFASPAAALWAGSRQRRTPLWHGIRFSVGAVTLLLALYVLSHPMDWKKVGIVWTLSSLVLSLLVAVIFGSESQETSPNEVDLGSETEKWSTATIRSLIPLVVLVPSFHMTAKLAAWWLFGDLLVQLNAKITDPASAFATVAAEAFWTIPCGILFVALSRRAGRLRSDADVVRAGLTWACLLVAWEFVIHGSFSAFKSQLLNAPGFENWGLGSASVLYIGFVVALVPLALFLAWGRGNRWIRFGSVILLVLAGFLNLGLSVGSNAIVQFSVARTAERSGDVEAALHWYESSLQSSSSTALAPFLNHRIGLLRYKTGNVEGARESFQALVTAGETDSELYRQGVHFLERLKSPSGERVVLPGMEVRTQRRRAYCAPNTLSLVFEYFGQDFGVTRFAEQSTELGSGTSLSSIVQTADTLGFDHYLVAQANLDDVRWLIDQGMPALLYTPGHVSAVLGYDSMLETLVSYDTSTYDVWVDLPLNTIEADWGQTQFLLGVVVPRNDSATSAAVRARFDTPWAAATWQWWLSQENPKEGLRYIKRALEIEPSFYPAFVSLFNQTYGTLAHRHAARWFPETVDASQMATATLEALKRPWADRQQLAFGLALYYRSIGDSDALLELARALERVEQSWMVQPIAGVVAAEQENWTESIGMLESTLDDSEDPSLNALQALIRSHLALEQPEVALDLISDLSTRAWDDRTEWSLEIADQHKELGGAQWFERIYQESLASRFEGSKQYARLAELSIAALAEDPEGREARLVRAKGAASIARALARTDEEKETATNLLTQLNVLGQDPTERELAL